MRLDNRLFKLLPYVFVTILGFTPLIWFFGKEGYLINGVDINFPLDPQVWFQRRFFVWNGISNAGADFSSSSAGLFFHLIQVIPYSLGFNLTQVQAVSLIFWFLLIVLSAYWFSRMILPNRPLLQILFVVLYSFNIYMFNSWENIKVANLSLVAAIPLALSILHLLHEKKISYAKAIFFSSLIGIILSGGGINPSYFITFFITVFIYIFADFLTHIRSDSLKSVAVNFAAVVIPTVLINLFWILPTLNFILNNISSAGSLDKLGFTNWVDSLSENTSLVNILRLQGAWDWYAVDGITNQPLYIPYALNYFYRLPFLVFSFFLPSMAFLAFLFVNNQNRNLYASFGAMLLVGVFLGTGTHLPTGIFFRWLTEHIPFFTFFRSPWYIFSPLVTLSYAGLVCLFLYNFKIKKTGVFLNNFFIFLVSTILIAGNLIYSYPLVTGKIFRPASPDGFYINFPNYVYDAKKWLDGENDGRIIGYPDDEIERFRWGYRGIESILNLLTSRETLFSPLNNPDSPMAIMIKSFYNHLKKREWFAAQNLAVKMDANKLFFKKDQDSLSGPLPEKLNDFPSVNLGQWTFYTIPQSRNQKVYIPSKVFFAYPYFPASEGVEITGFLGSEEVLLNPEDSVIADLPAITRNSGRAVLSRSSQGKDLTDFKFTPSILANRLLIRDLAQVKFDFTAPEDGSYKPILERYAVEDFGIDLTKDLTVENDGVEKTWKIDKFSDTYLYFQPVEFSSGKHSIVIKLSNQNLVNGADFEGAISFEKGGYGEGFGEYKIEDGNGGKFLSILNIGEADVSANLAISSLDPMSSYYIELKYKQIYGNNANVVVGQNNANTLVKAQTERLPNYPEWHVFSFYFEPVKTQSQAKIILSAPFTVDPLGTKIFYDDLKVYKVFDNDLLFIKEGNFSDISPTIEIQKRSPVNYEGTVIYSDTPHILTFAENYSPMWKLQLFDTNGSKLDIKLPHLSANLYSNGWYIRGAPLSYKFKIFYEPQNLFWVGLAVSILTTILSSAIFLSDFRGKKSV